jgi:hypothetical protein
MGMARAWLAGLLLLALGVPPALRPAPAFPGSPAILGKGPLPIRNQSPVQLLFLQLAPEGARPVPREVWEVRADLVETNTLVAEGPSPAGFAGVLNFEQTRLNVTVRRGLWPGGEGGIELPFVYGWGGILDSFIDAFEHLIDMRRDLRRDEVSVGGQNRYRYSITRNGGAFLQGESGDWDIGDLALTAKHALWEEPDASLALRAGVKLPTGRPSRATGSGDVDLALGIAGDLRRPPLAAYANLSGTLPLGRFRGESVNPIVSGLLGLEVALTETSAFLVQVEGISAPFSGTGLAFLDDPIFQFQVGLRFLLRPNLLLDVGIIEDFWFQPVRSVEASADFSVYASLRATWGP